MCIQHGKLADLSFQRYRLVIPKGWPRSWRATAMAPATAPPQRRAFRLWACNQLRAAHLTVAAAPCSSPLCTQAAAGCTLLDTSKSVDLHFGAQKRAPHLCGSGLSLLVRASEDDGGSGVRVVPVRCSKRGATRVVLIRETKQRLEELGVERIVLFFCLLFFGRADSGDWARHGQRADVRAEAPQQETNTNPAVHLAPIMLARAAAQPQVRRSKQTKQSGVLVVKRLTSGFGRRQTCLRTCHEWR